MTAATDSEAPIVPGEASAEMIEAGAKALYENVRGFLGLVNDWASHVECDPGSAEEMRENARITINAALAATHSAPPADLEAESREILAANDLLDAEPHDEDCDYWAARGKDGENCSCLRERAIRAIRALSARQIAQGVGDTDPPWLIHQLSAAAYYADVDEGMSDDWRAGAASAYRKALNLAEQAISPPPSVEADAMVERLRGLMKQADLPHLSVPGERGWAVEQDEIDAAERALSNWRNYLPALITRLSGGEVER